MPTMLIAPEPVIAQASETEMVALALERVKRRDFAGAVQAIETIGEPAGRWRAQLALGSALTALDPSTAATLALYFPSGPAREAGLERAVRNWAGREPAAALQWALDLDDPAAAAVARRAVATELVRANARPTIERVLALPAGPARDEVLVLATGTWAQIDPEAAVGWLRELPEGELRSRVAPGIGFEVAQSNPRRAIALAETLPQGRDRWLLFAAIGQTWAAVDSKAALAWARELPAGEASLAAFAGVDTGLGVPGSRRMVGAPNTRGGGIRTRGGGVALSGLSAVDTPEFLAWLATQPEGLSRDDAIVEYVRQRGPGAGAGLGPWVAALPGGPTKERAMEIFVDSLLIGSPAEAADWLRQLPRSDRSDEWVERTARQWLSTNPAAAEMWLRDIPLPPERKAQLLREAGR
ncbi:MAG: hypothetical protein ABIQ12_01665 [Opitutaceae bacterium]